MREHVTRRLNRLRIQLEKLQLKLTDAGKVMYLDDVRATGRVLETLIGRLQAAAPPVAAAPAVTELDRALFGRLAGLEETAKLLAGSATPVQDLDRVQAAAAEAGGLLDQRDRLLGRQPGA